MRNSKLIPRRIESAEPTEPPKIDTTAFGRIFERGGQDEKRELMRALTILQPWAEMIARGVKRIENRTWRTSHRGPLTTHAGKSRKSL
jgi:hypothetical protein